MSQSLGCKNETYTHKKKKTHDDYWLYNLLVDYILPIEHPCFSSYDVDLF